MKRVGAVTVRPRTEADDQFIVKLAQPSFGQYSGAAGQTVHAMMNAPSARTLVAESGARRLGFAIVSFEALQRPFGPWARPVLASLDAIAVDEKAQGAGVGKALLDSALHVARAQQAVNMTLRTATSNARAQALFRRAGFQASLMIQAFYRNGQSAFAMTKLLAT